MKVAVLGAKGFLGKYIVNNLKGYDILPLSRDDFDFTNETAVVDWMETHRPDVVVNCAITGGGQQLGVFDPVIFQNNVTIHRNFTLHHWCYDKFINIGSGAEFGIDRNLDNVWEHELKEYPMPTDSYGGSKHYISKLSSSHRSYTLRLFGCFDVSEPNYRLFKKFLNGNLTELIDRKFDYISAKDFLSILKYYIDTPDPYFEDINCVYPEKHYLSEILEKFGKPVNITGISELNYTGSGARLEMLDIPLQGLDESIKEYLRDL